MVLNEKGNIKQFNLVIYPVDFVVVIGDFEKEVNEIYTPFQEEYNHIAPPTSTGSTYRVKEKKTGIACTLVWIKSKEEFTSSIVAHECGHAAMDIFDYIGTQPNPDDQEPYCYLLGNLVRLATGCFYEIPGVKAPVVKHDAFINPEKPKKEDSEIKPKAKKRGRPKGSTKKNKAIAELLSKM